MIIATLVGAALPALAATSASDAHAFDPAQLSLMWGLPFAGLLFSIALVPMASHKFLARPFRQGFGRLGRDLARADGIAIWHRHHVARSRAFVTAGVRAVCRSPVRAVHDRRRHLPMLLIRPLLAGNEVRQHRVHVVVFFILLVGNIGGALSPLGDPPLFIGYLKGVDFFWTTRALALPTIALCVVLLAAFYMLDSMFARREPPPNEPEVTRGPVRLEGARNLLLLAGVVGAVLYIGNAPNFMIKAIAEDRGIATPSFFGYLAYANLALSPLLAIIELVTL
jgi:hypothetical protein